MKNTDLFPIIMSALMGFVGGCLGGSILLENGQKHAWQLQIVQHGYGHFEIKKVDNTQDLYQDFEWGPK